MSAALDRTPDLAAMQAFQENIKDMSEVEITAAVKWMWERAVWELDYRRRWPWRELDE